MSICNVIIVMKTLENYLTDSVFRREIRALYKIVFTNNASQAIYEDFFFKFTIYSGLILSVYNLFSRISPPSMCSHISAMLNCCKHF